MPIFGEKPFTSITVKVNQLCKIREDNESIELYLGDLLSLISLQSTGPSEAARALRKNIKYGNNSEAKLAMNLLELLVLNGGLSIGKAFASDDKLISVIRSVLKGSNASLSRDPYDEETVQTMRAIAIGWSSELKDLPGLQPLANLYKDIPKTRSRNHFNEVATRGALNTVPAESLLNNSLMQKNASSLEKVAPRRPKTLSPSLPVSESFRTSKRAHSNKRRDKKSKAYADLEFKIPQINYKVEAPKIRSTIADCQTNATALENSILALPPNMNAELDPSVQNWFKKCKATRRSVLRYLQFVGAGNVAAKDQDVRKLDEEFLGSLIAANDQLVCALKRYDFACGVVSYNTGSDVESSSSDEHFYRSDSSNSDSEGPTYTREQPDIPRYSNTERIPNPSQFERPGELSENPLSEDNPFGDPH